MNKEIDGGKTELADSERELAAAEKTLAALEKAKADPATAKKLDAAIKDAGAALKTLRTNLGEYEKYAAEAAKNDAKIDETAAGLLKLGTLKSAMEAQLSKLRTPYGGAISELREFGAKLKAMPG